MLRLPSAIVTAVLLAPALATAHMIQAPGGPIIDYTPWERNGADCCGNRDCRPVEWRFNRETGQEEILVNGVWRAVERDKVLPGTSRDGRAHACPAGPSKNTYIRCIKLPGFGT